MRDLKAWEVLQLIEDWYYARPEVFPTRDDYINTLRALCAAIFRMKRNDPEVENRFWERRIDL